MTLLPASEQLLNEMSAAQKQVLLKIAEMILPEITADDLLQPNDFPELEGSPLFRYEEGVLAGLQMALIALRREARDLEHV